jgi:hypothetical protein
VLLWPIYSRHNAVGARASPGPHADVSTAQRRALAGWGWQLREPATKQPPTQGGSAASPPRESTPPRCTWLQGRGRGKKGGADHREGQLHDALLLLHTVTSWWGLHPAAAPRMLARSRARQPTRVRKLVRPHENRSVARPVEAVDIGKSSSPGAVPAAQAAARQLPADMQRCTRNPADTALCKADGRVAARRMGPGWN